MSEIDDRIALLEAELAPLRAKKAEEANIQRRADIAQVTDIINQVGTLLREASRLAKPHYYSFTIHMSGSDYDSSRIEFDGYDYILIPDGDNGWSSSSYNC